MFVRQLTYLVTLAQVAPAAEACHVSQPALSSAIQRLEDELGVSIVQRRQHFEGLTSEGERLLIWARRIVDNCEGLRQEATAAREQLTGTLRLGAIPTAPASYTITHGALSGGTSRHPTGGAVTVRRADHPSA